MAEFVHLHLHSHFSTLDSIIKIPELIAHVRKCGMNAVAVTDHGVASASIRLYTEAIKTKDKSEKEIRPIKPIIGMEAYLSPTDDHTLKEKVEGHPPYYHITLLAKNSNGVSNIYKLTSIGYLEGFYYKPRISLKLLEEYGDDLIIMGGCGRGPVNWPFLPNTQGSKETALRFAERLSQSFKERFYLELMDHNLDWQKPMNESISHIATSMNIPLVPTNDAHFLLKEQHHLHCLAMCSQLRKDLNGLEESGMKYSEECYVKTPEEMELLFGKDLCRQTIKIAEQIDIRLKLGEPLLPPYKGD